MNNDIRMHIIIKTNSETEKLAVGEKLHQYLVGNKDYINNNIVLNIDSPNEVNLYIMQECISIPEIIL